MLESIHSDKAALAAAAADHLAAAAARAIATRGHFALALSGGSTPWAMLAEFAEREVDWAHVHVFQVDERAVPDGDDARNWTHVNASLLDRVPIPAGHAHPMPVLDDPETAATAYAATLGAVLGATPVLDVVQLGMGADGHTASLIPADPVLEVADRDVAWAVHPYQGTRRMTLTFPCLARAREVVWLVAGADKRPMVERLRAADPTIPAGRVPQDNATLFADAAAAD